MLDIAPQIEQAILNQAQTQGKTVNELLADIFITPEQQPTLFEAAMAYDGVDVSDIEFEPIAKLPTKNRFLELD